MGLIYGLVVGFDGCCLLVDAVLERKEEEEKEENMLGIIRQKVSVRSSALLVLWFVLFMKFRGVSTYFSIYFFAGFWDVPADDSARSFSMERLLIRR